MYGSFCRSGDDLGHFARERTGLSWYSLGRWRTVSLSSLWQSAPSTSSMDGRALPLHVHRYGCIWHFYSRTCQGYRNIIIFFFFKLHSELLPQKYGVFILSSFSTAGTTQDAIEGFCNRCTLLWIAKLWKVWNVTCSSTVQVEATEERLLCHCRHTRKTLRFLTLFFRSYICLTGPFSCISLGKSALALI